MIHDLFKNGNSSRKFFVMLVAMLLLTVMTVATTWSVGIATALVTFVGGITALAGLYFAGNVAGKWADKKEKEKE